MAVPRLMKSAGLISVQILQTIKKYQMCRELSRRRAMGLVGLGRV